MQTQITRTYLYPRTAENKSYPRSLSTGNTNYNKRAVNKQSIARSETSGHVASVAMPTRKIASARKPTHARTPRAPTRLHAFEPGSDPNAKVEDIETR